MTPASEERPPAASWRVVVFTVIPGGTVYHRADAVLSATVSYTHLTLPTICSV